MIIYNSMILWIVFMSLVHKGLFSKFSSSKSNASEKKDYSYRVTWGLAVITFAYIIYWIGIRTEYGDTTAYIMNFGNTPNSLESLPSFLNRGNHKKAIGFHVICITFKEFVSVDHHKWLMFLALIQGFSVMYTLKRKSTHFFYSAFLFIVSLNFTWMMNGIRQFAAASGMFLLTDWIEKKETKKFVVAVLVLSTIHYTAIVMLPVYFFVTDKPFGKKMILFILGLLLAVMMLEPFLNTVEDVILEGTAYSGYTSQFSKDDGVNPMRVVVAFVPVGLAFFSRKRIEEQNNKFINICINMSIISAGLYFLGVFTSGILVGRLPIYFELYTLILLPYLLDVTGERIGRRLMYSLCTLGYLAYYKMLSGALYYVSDTTGFLN